MLQIRPSSAGNKTCILFFKALRLAVGPTRHPTQWIPGVKWLEPEFAYLNPATAAAILNYPFRRYCADTDYFTF